MEINQEILKSLLRYEPDTGCFYWLVSHANDIKAGKRAGSIGNRGYRFIGIDGCEYREHRLVWLYVYGRWPDSQIDHINHVRGDNRLSNLREVNTKTNNRNRPICINNRSGQMGVTLDKRRQKWEANITVDGKKVFLGYHSEIADAITVRKAAEVEYGFHKNHGAEND